MAWWGKIIGGGLGFVSMGPLGALLGTAIGHMFDKGLTGLDAANVGGAWGTDNEEIQAGFFTATFSVMGHIAKADGHVSESEIANARQIMANMQLNEEQKRAAISLFQQGKEAGFDLSACLQQLRHLCGRRVNLLRIFLEIQLATALADGELHANEQVLLSSIAEALGFKRRQFEQMLAMVLAQRRFNHHDFNGAGSERQPSQGASLADAYQILGIAENASDAEVKKAYRKLMSQHHPDKLVSKGLPEEMMQVATEKTREIKEAYELIKRSRR